MVNGNAAYVLDVNAQQNIELVESPVKYCTVTLSDVLTRGKRLEASVFDVKAKHAHDMIAHGKYPAVSIGGKNGLIKDAYYPGRFKRIYCDSGSGEPFYLPSQMTDIYPKADKNISSLTNCNINELKLKTKTLLLTRSGTIGTVSYVSKTIEGHVFSDDVIRVTFKNDVDLGYVYTYLKSKVGNIMLTTNGYGSVITHIEPEHLSTVPIPDAPPLIKKRINDLIVGSYELRDASNELIDKANNLLIRELELPPIEEFQRHATYYQKNAPVNTFSVKLSNLDGRLEGSYHVPVVDAIVAHMEKYAAEVTTVGDRRISKKIILPGRFKRVYVEEGHGRVFIGGKQLYELDPTNKKYLSLVHHGDRISKQLELHEGMILITCSGTIGKVALVGKHWENWTANQHIIRVVPTSRDIAGYLSIFLASEYGYPLITRYTYGAVVDEINDTHVSKVPVPLLKDTNVQQHINELALAANEKRYEAYKMEQQALRIMDRDVIFAK